MSLSLAILEDEDDRRRAMADCFQDRFPQYPIRFFATAAEMIWYLQRHRSELIAIALDHDLELVPITDRENLDSGTGRNVADFLATVAPTCPVVIHTTNEHAGFAMEETLRQAGWPTSRVVPYGDLEWISEVWFRVIRDAIVAYVATESHAVATTK